MIQYLYLIPPIVSLIMGIACTVMLYKMIKQDDTAWIFGVLFGPGITFMYGFFIFGLYAWLVENQYINKIIILGIDILR